MGKVRFLDDLTWESKSYKAGEIREFYENKELKGTGELKGEVLEFNFEDPSVLNCKRRNIPIIYELLEAPKKIKVEIKINGKTEYTKEKNTGIIGEVIYYKDIEGIFKHLRYADVLYRNIYFRNFDEKFFIYYKNDKLQEFSVTNKFYLLIDDFINESRKDNERTYEVKRRYKVKVLDFMTACEVYGQFRQYYSLTKLDSEELEIVERMLKAEIEERLPEIIFEDEDFKEFVNLNDRTPENIFAVQKLYKYVPKLNFEETVNMLEKLDDATFKFLLCGLGNEIDVSYSKKGINFYIKEKISFEKLVELFKAIEPLRKYGKISISTDDIKLHLEETDEEIVFHKGRKAAKDLKLLEKLGKFDKKVEMLINDSDRFVIDGNGKIGITKSSLEKYNLKDFETYIL